MTGRSKLDRRDVVAKILVQRDAALVVSGLGGTTWDVAAVGDHEQNFYLWGGMGLAVSTGLGLALAQPSKRVIVITGDGEMLMGVGSLATVGVAAPTKLGIVVIDNERYGETGDQLTHTATSTDLVAMARGAGIHNSARVSNEQDLAIAISSLYETEGPVFINIKVDSVNPPMCLPPRDGIHVKNRFRAGLGLSPN